MKTRDLIRRHGTTAALLLVAAGGVAYVVLDRDRATTQELERRKQNLIPVWRADEVTEVVFTAKGKTAKLVASATGDGGIRRWSVELDGATHPAAEQTVDQLLGTLEFASFERQANPDARGGAKLDTPRVRAEVLMGGKRWIIQVGGPAPSPNGTSYAEVEGRGLYVITDQLASALDVDVARLRSRRIVPYVSTELSGFTIERAGAKPFNIVRAPWSAGQGGGYRFDGPGALGQVRVDSSALDKMLTTLGGLESETFLDDASARAASRPEVTLTMLPKGASPKGVLVIGGACPLPEKAALIVAVRTSPTFVGACVPKATLTGLSIGEDAWVDRHPIAALFDEVTELHVTRGAAKLELVRSGTSFRQRAPTERVVDASIGTEVLERLLALGAPTLGSGGKPSGEALATLEVVSLAIGASGERREKLVVYPPKDGIALALREEDGAVLELAEASLRDLLPTELHLRSRRLLAAQLKSVRRLRVVTKGAKRDAVQEVVRDAAGGSFSLSEPKVAGLGVDAGLAGELGGAMASLEAVRFVAAKDDGTFGLAEPRFIVELDVDDDGADAGAPKTHKLLVGAPTEGGFFGKLSGDEAVFVVPKALEAAASRLLLDRAALLFEDADLFRVVVKTKKAKLELARTKNGGLEVLPKPDGTKAAQVSGSLTELIAEGVVHLGAPGKADGFDEPELEILVESEGGKKRVELLVGAGDSFRGTPVLLVRKKGVDATFAVARSRLKPLREALGLE